MLVECISIIMVILMVAFIFLRSHRKDYAITTLPLLVLPMMHILSLALARHLTGMFSLNAQGIMVALDATALVISCTVLGFFSNRIPVPKSEKCLFGHMRCICCNSNLGFDCGYTCKIITNKSTNPNLLNSVITD